MTEINKNTIFESLALLYNTMDKTWDMVAHKYPFKCNGCEDNCCKSLFFHHTHIEKAYFLHGFNQLDQDKKEIILTKANIYYKKTFPQDSKINGSKIKSLKLYCPANEDGLCLLYVFRPMICRLHGLPHELCKPGFKPFLSSGCNAGQFDDKPYIKFDRTPFYQQMAQIEIAFRNHSNKDGKIKQSIAQMLLSQ
ncbi:MAG: hypothetical protein GY699_17455 [Desulfobacteraceae bacterium]|nr:hypothetical protein [Desulfobacteraceae bacterium]